MFWLRDWFPLSSLLRLTPFPGSLLWPPWFQSARKLGTGQASKLGRFGMYLHPHFAAIAAWLLLAIVGVPRVCGQGDESGKGRECVLERTLRPQPRLDLIRHAVDSIQHLRIFVALPGLFRGGKLSCGFQDLAGQIVGHARIV